MKNNNNQTQTVPEKSFLEKIIQWGTLITVFCTPLLFWKGRIAAAITSKQYFFIGMVDLLLICVVWLWAADSRYRITKKGLLALIPTTVVIVSAGISSLLGSNILVSLFSTVERGGGLIFLVHAFMFSVIIAAQVRIFGMQLVKKILRAFVGSGVVVALFTFFTNEAINIGSEWLNTSVGGAMLGNSTIAGSYFTFIIFLGFILIILESERYKKIGTIIATGIIFFSPILSGITRIVVDKNWGGIIDNPLLLIGQARAAALAVMIGVVISGLCYFLYSSKNKIIKAASVIGIISIFVGMGYVSTALFQKDSFVQKEFIKQVGENRLLFWNISRKGIAERPIFGWGPENYKTVHQKYLNPLLADKAHGAEVWVDKPHNVIIEILVTQGYVGLVVYVIFILSLVFLIHKIIKKEDLPILVGVALYGMIFAYLLQNLLAFDTITSIVTLFGVTGILIGLYNQNNNQKVYSDMVIIVKLVLGFTTVVLFGCWLVLAYLPARKTVAIQKFFDAPIDVRISMYDPLYSGIGSYIVKTSQATIFYKASEIYLAQRKDIKKDPEFLKAAVVDTKKMLEIGDKNRKYTQDDYRFVLAQTIFQSNLIFFTEDYSSEQVAKAINYSAEALALSPTNPAIYMIRSLIYLYAEDVDSGRLSIDAAVALNPNFFDAQIQKNVFEKAFGTRQQQREALENAQKYIPGFEFK